jgi:hypothetical protein
MIMKGCFIQGNNQLTSSVFGACFVLHNALYSSPLNNQTKLRKKICNYVNAKDRERNEEVQ